MGIFGTFFGGFLDRGTHHGGFLAGGGFLGRGTRRKKCQKCPFRAPSKLHFSDKLKANGGFFEWEMPLQFSIWPEKSQNGTQKCIFPFKEALF